MSKYLDLDDVVADHPIAKAELEKLTRKANRRNKEMLDFIILHTSSDGAEAAVYPQHIEQMVAHDLFTIIYYASGSHRYKETLQEIFAKMRELDAAPPPVRRPAPSHMGAVESKHGRVTE